MTHKSSVLCHLRDLDIALQEVEKVKKISSLVNLSRGIDKQINRDVGRSEQNGRSLGHALHASLKILSSELLVLAKAETF